MQQDPNYGRSEEPRLTQVPVGGTMSPQEERTWSVLAHLSVLLNIITVIGGPIAALVIWLVYKDRSQRVAFHALQSLWYQVVWVVILFAYVIVSFVLTIVIIGFFMLVLMPLIALIPLVHQCYATYKVNQGVDYRYPFIADVIDHGRRFSGGGLSGVESVHRGFGDDGGGGGGGGDSGGGGGDSGGGGGGDSGGGGGGSY